MRAYDPFLMVTVPFCVGIGSILAVLTLVLYLAHP